MYNDFQEHGTIDSGMDKPQGEEIFARGELQSKKVQIGFDELLHGPIEKENVGHIIKENDGCGM